MEIDKRKENMFFKNRNMIRITEDDLDTPIFRVFQKTWLLYALRNQKNTLVKPKLWDDPFENFIFNSIAETDKGYNVSFEEIRENYYGQCWTFSAEETDALWRIYSPNKDGFRVKTTIRKLFDLFYDADHRFAMIAFYIGRILYDSEVAIKDYFENSENLKNHIYDGSGNGQVETLLIKRLEFKHENELRLIFNAHKDWFDTSQDTYDFPIDINHTFEELLADPRMDDNGKNIFADSIKDIRALGYDNLIEKSKLYQIPNLKLKL